MSLEQMAQSATQEFSKIVAAERGLEDIQQGEIARAALVKCFEFGLSAQKVPTEFKSLCNEKGLAHDGFNWPLAIRCVYGETVPKSGSSNETTWVVSKSNQVISKYGRILSYAQANNWGKSDLEGQLAEHGIERLVTLAREHEVNRDKRHKGSLPPLFSQADLARINAKHYVDVPAFDVPDEAFRDGFATFLVQKEDVGFRVWAADADDGAILKVAAPFRRAESVREHLSKLIALANLSTDDDLFIHNTVDGCMVTGFGKVSFVAKGAHVHEFPIGWVKLSKDERSSLKKLIKHFGDIVFEWGTKQHQGKTVVAISGPADINAVVFEIKDKAWKPNTTAKFVYQALHEEGPKFADGTERKVVPISGAPIQLNADCIEKMKRVNKKEDVEIRSGDGHLRLIQGKGRPLAATHDGDPIELTATVAKGLLNKAVALLPDGSTKLYLAEDTAQFEFEQDGFVVRVEI